MTLSFPWRVITGWQAPYARLRHRNGFAPLTYQVGLFQAPFSQCADRMKMSSERDVQADLATV